MALALNKSQSQRMNRRKKGLIDVDDELEQFYAFNCLTFNKKITSSKVTYNGNEQFSVTLKL